MTDPIRKRAARLLSFLMPIALAFAAMPASAAIDPDDLLPVDDAFALRAEASSPDRIEISWRIADGYYLYRHRIAVQADAGFAAQPLQLPKGDAHEDEFFGKVETYRQQLTAVLPGQASARQVTLKIKYQGCADAGICYPPQTRSVTVALPGATAQDGAKPLVNFGPRANAPLGGGLLGQNAGTATGADALPLPPEQAFGFEAIAGDGNTLLLRFTPARGYYLYRDKTTLKLDAAAIKAGFALGAPRWPKGVAHRDEHFGNVVVYFDQIDVPVPVSARTTEPATLHLTAGFQGCQTDGICYPPMTRVVDVALPGRKVDAIVNGTLPVPAPEVPLKGSEPVDASPVAGDVAALPQAADASSTKDTASNAAANNADQAEDARLAAALSGKGRWFALLTFFALGLGLSFTPCVLPMIPILSGLIAGQGPNLGVRRALTLSFVYVLASAVVFTAAGVVAGLVGANLQVAFQKPWVIVAFATLFVVLSLSSFGLYELQLPSSLRSRLGAMSDRQRGGSLAGVAMMGALSALIVGPCVAPPLAAAVLYIGQTQDPAFGGAALFLLAMGMGVPLLVFGVAAGKGLPTSGPWMVAVQRAFGFVFLGLAVWMLSRIVPASATLALWGVLLVAAAATTAVSVRQSRHDGARIMGWTAALVLGLFGAAQLIGAMAGSRDPFKPLAGLVGGGSVQEAELSFRTIKSTADLDREIAAAQASGKPLMLDFYADWCVACKEMEKYTFPDAAVHKALDGFVLLKADVTANDDADQALMKRLGIIGPPATLWFRDGAERRELRLFGFEDAENFVERAGRATR